MMNNKIAKMILPVGSILLWIMTFGAENTPPVQPEPYLKELIDSGQHEYVLRPVPGRDEFLLMRSDDKFDTSILRFVRVNEVWRAEGTLPLSFAGQVAYPSFSKDGKFLFFTGLKENEAPDLWLAERSGDGWGEPRQLPQDVNSPAVEMLTSVAWNGNLYFSSNRPGGQGDFDLYAARWTGSGYAPAENLGQAVNTNAFEAHPFIAPDESYLLFDARRKEGRGQNDIYLSIRQTDGSWSKAEMLQYPGLNTAFGDMRPSVSEDGSILWFCSDRLGSQDIFWVDWRRVRQGARR